MSSYITKSIVINFQFIVIKSIVVKLQFSSVRPTQSPCATDCRHSAKSVDVCFSLKPAYVSPCNSSKTNSVIIIGCKVKYECKLFSISITIFPHWTLIPKLYVGSCSQ